MHTQVKSLKSVRIAIPEELTNRSFVFTSYFALGDEKTTNLSERLGDFDHSFFNNAKCKCQMPSAFSFVDQSAQQSDSFKNVTEFCDPWDSRVPIKFVGFLKQNQLTAGPGYLLTDGSSNYFVCRSCDDKLKLVELCFHQRTHSWKISSTDFDFEHLIKGPSRIFLACR